jgi:hypothetical protein
MTPPLSNEIPKLNLTPLHLEPEGMLFNEEPDIDIDPKKSLPAEAMEIKQEEIDTVKLQGAVDETISIKEKKGWPIGIPLAITVMVLTAPLTIAGFVIGGAGGLLLGIIKKRFMWDYEYDKEIKTQPYLIRIPLSEYTGLKYIPIGKLKSIRSETIDSAVFLASILSIYALYRFSDEYQKDHPS